MGEGGQPPVRATRSNLSLRIWSGLVLGLLALGAVWLGGIAFRLFCAAIGVLVLFEWCAMTRPFSRGAVQALGGALLAVGLVLLLLGNPWTVAYALTAAVAMIAVGLGLERQAWTAAGFAYALAASVPLALLRGEGTPGFYTVLVLFATVWGTDILAYFVGRAVGGPKLAPAISPGKTWSGAIGGAVSGVALGSLVAFASGFPVDLRLAALLLVLSVASQAGDLLESWVKRRSGVKDSGWIIPGHGGVMDRVDGLIAASLVLWLAAGLSGGFGDPSTWLARG